MSSTKSTIKQTLSSGVPDSGHIAAWSLLSDWLKDVTHLVQAATKGLHGDVVHDLRVTLRRCRSAAIGFEQLDPSPDWRRLRKEAKRILRGLGDIRDVQVMRKWISKLGMAETPSGKQLLEILLTREGRAIRRAHRDLKKCDRKKWREWSRELPERVRRIPAESPAFELLVVQQWTEAFELHRAAMKLRSKISYHRLRIGLKRFRYSVECFLPSRHAAWGRDLKKVQDYLGQVHDLDVLWAAVLRLRPILANSERKKWRAAIENVRDARLTAYHEKMSGDRSRLEKWRVELPSGTSLEACRLDWLGIWSSFLDPHAVHSRRVARLATQFFDGAQKVKGAPRVPKNARDLLEAAAILRDVGRAEGDRHHQKTSFRIIRKQSPPPGWSEWHMNRIACIARFHRGALPSDVAWKGWTEIPEQERAGLKLLGGILRLCATFAGSIEPKIESIEAGQRGEVFAIRATGYRGEEPLASRLAEARHLLESVLHRPVVIEPAN
jgi:CHAD domain-containing protein